MRKGRIFSATATATATATTTATATATATATCVLRTLVPPAVPRGGSRDTARFRPGGIGSRRGWPGLRCFAGGPSDRDGGYGPCPTLAWLSFSSLGGAYSPP